MGDIIIFQPLTPGDIKKIVELQIKHLSQRLAAQAIAIKVTPAVADYLARAGYDPVYGARPLRRVIERYILDELSLFIIEGKIKSGDQVTVDVRNGKMELGIKNKE